MRNELKRAMRLAIAEVAGDGMLMARRAKSCQGGDGMLLPDDGRASRVIVVTCPDYGNLGDHAIAYAERMFLQSHVARPVTMLYGPLERQWRALVEQVRRDDIICLQGGGSMGTLYECYENERLALIVKFRDNRIVLFPQTFSYGHGPYDRRYVRHMEKVYGEHRDLHIVARERMSLERMRRHFPKADVLLTPDIVLSLPPFDTYPGDREGLCLCLRSDKERRIDVDAIDRLAAAARGRYSRVVRTDTMHQKNLLVPNEGEQAVREKMAELARAELVVTDRIHGMIFCALTGTPCIALDNSNGKVREEYGWLAELPYLVYAKDVDEAAELVRHAALHPGRYPAEDFEPLFRPLAELFREG